MSSCTSQHWASSYICFLNWLKFSFKYQHHLIETELWRGKGSWLIVNFNDVSQSHYFLQTQMTQLHLVCLAVNSDEMIKVTLIDKHWLAVNILLNCLTSSWMRLASIFHQLRRGTSEENSELETCSSRWGKKTLNKGSKVTMSFSWTWIDKLTLHVKYTHFMINSQTSYLSHSLYDSFNQYIIFVSVTWRLF